MWKLIAAGAFAALLGGTVACENRRTETTAEQQASQSDRLRGATADNSGKIGGGSAGAGTYDQELNGAGSQERSGGVGSTAQLDREMIAEGANRDGGTAKMGGDR